MEPRRIRRVRRPTRWQRWVWRCQAWLDDALERVVCCGVDTASLPEVEDLRFAFGERKPSSMLSILSMKAVDDDDQLISHALRIKKAKAKLSDTDSDSGDEQPIDDDDSSIDMDDRHSVATCDDDIQYRHSIRSDFIPFDDEEEEDQYEATLRLSAVAVEDLKQQHSSSAPSQEYHRALFNCVLVDLLSSYHPVQLWTSYLTTKLVI